MSRRDAWSRFREELIATMGETGIRAAYESLGCRWTGKVSASGWAHCYALGRDERHPSAGVNIETGAYNDFAGQHLGLLDAMAEFGPFGDWQEALKSLAKDYHLLSKVPKSDSNRPADRIVKEQTQNQILTRGLRNTIFRSESHRVSGEHLQEMGCWLAAYPAKAPKHLRQRVVVFPVFSTSLLDEPAESFVICRADGQLLDVFRGKDAPPDKEKRITLGTSGLLNSFAMSRLESAEWIIKVEGVSDMIALHSIIPDEDKERYVVTSTAAGASEIEAVFQFSPLFSGRRVAILHDCDLAGQFGAAATGAAITDDFVAPSKAGGAALWCEQLVRHSAIDVRNIQLPYELSEKQGKDLRDWINDGHGWQDFLNLLNETQPHKSPGEDTDSGEETDRHRVILKHAGVTILGQVEGSDQIVGFSHLRGKKFVIRDIDRIKMDRAIVHIGAELEERVSETVDPILNKGLPTFQSLKRAIAVEASRTVISDMNHLGPGIWEIDDHLVMVNDDQVGLYNGSYSSSRIPGWKGKLFDFAATQWFDSDFVEQAIKQADRKFVQSALADAVKLFRSWDNWKDPCSAELAAAMTIATWTQSVFPWRPTMVVTGPRGSGKSTFLEDVLPAIYGELCLPVSKPTEAGLRNLLGGSAKILTIDEFEGDKNRRAVLELLRTSSRGSRIARGTADQKGRLFAMNHIPWIGAIEVGMTEGADATRCIVMQLTKLPKGHKQMQLPSKKAIRRLGQRLLVAAMVTCRKTKEIYSQIVSTTIPDVDFRVVESFALPSAVIAAIEDSGESGGQKWLRSFLQDRDLSATQVDDEEELVDAIFQSEVWQTGGTKFTVIQILKMSEEQWVQQTGGRQSQSQVLERVGIKRVREHNGEPNRMFFLKGSIQRRLLKDTDWRYKNIDELLIRIPGAVRSRHRVGNARVYGIMIPQKSIESLVHAEPFPMQFRDEDGSDEDGSDVDFLPDQRSKAGDPF